MKILLCFPQQDKQTGLYLREALEDLGNDVVIFDPRAHTPESAADRLVDAVRAASPHWVLSSREANLAAALPDVRKHCPFVVWSMDVRPDLAWWGPWMALFRGADAFFTIGKSDVPQFRAAGVENVFWLPEGCSDRHHRSIDPADLPGDEWRYYASDVSFCGNLDPIHDSSSMKCGIRSEILRAVGRAFKLKVWGAGLGLPSVINEEHNKVIACSKIHLGCSVFPEVEASMSARDYRALGSGAILITNRVVGIESVLNEDIVRTYGDADECVTLVTEVFDEWRRDPEEMQRKREAIARYAHEQHSFRRRIVEMIDILKNEGIVRP